MMSAERIALATLLSPGNRERLKELADRITRGAVFIYPTETIYGIGGRFDNPEVYNRIIAAKKRPPDQAMIVIATDFSSFSSMGISFPPVAGRLADAFWPGLLTLILPAADNPDGVAVRVSNHPFLTGLAPFFDLPLFSSSANTSGAPYNPDPDIVYNSMKDSVDFMVDAGVLPASKPSTIVRVNSDDTLAVVREGCIPSAEIYSLIK